MDKLDFLKKLALGGAAMLTAEEAEGAGLSTIAQKLGIGLEEAAKIKKLAMDKVPQDLFEENIRAIQTVHHYKQSPDAFPKIGSGVDFRALQSPDGRVLKVPKDLTEDNDMFRVAPSLVEQVGLGPKTKTIQAGDRSYMLQDKVTPLDNLKADSLIKNDAEYQKLNDELMKVLTAKDFDMKLGRDGNIDRLKLRDDKVGKISQALANRKQAILKESGLNVDELKSYYNSLPEPEKRGFSNRFIVDSEKAIEHDPRNAFEGKLNLEAQAKLKKYIEPFDMHSGNIGVDASGKPTIFDTSRFEQFKPGNLTPEMRQEIMNSNISLPEKKVALKRLLEGQKNNPLVVSEAEVMRDLENAFMRAADDAPPTNQIKFAAGAAAMPTGTQMLTDPLKDLGQVWANVRKPINDTTKKIGEVISDTVTPPGMLPERQMQEQRDMAGGISQMVLDPANLLSPGLGLAAGAADMAAPEGQEMNYESIRQMLAKPPVKSEDEQIPTISGP